MDAFFQLGESEQLQPARYFAAMDAMVYLREDLSYRSDPVDSFLTVLMHPSENRAIGIKLKGFRYAFNEVRKEWGLGEQDFIYLTDLIAHALRSGWGDSICETIDERRRKYVIARDIAAESQKFRVKDWQSALAGAA